MEQSHPRRRGRTFGPGFLAVLLGLICVLPLTGRAHDVGLSSLQFHPDGSWLLARLTFARPDVEGLFPGGLPTAGAKAQSGAANLIATRLLELQSHGQTLWPATVTIHPDADNGVRIEARYPVLAGVVRVRAACLSELPQGHRQHASVRDEAGNLLRQWMLDASHSSFEMDLSAVAPATEATGLVRFLTLGIEHIVTGYDHLIFLLGLLIIGAGLKPTIKIVTAFTVAHSLTLGLVALEIVRVPASIVEPLIAASIVYIGLENVLRPQLRGRWLIAFAFGLIHGCGFGTALGDLGIGAGPAGVVWPLLFFNLGVEIGQLAITALLLPILWILRQRSVFHPRCVAACSVLIVAAGVFWLVQRLSF